MSNFIPYENYRKIVETLMDANAENMLLESKVTELQTNLDFQKETTELYHAKYHAYFYENRRLQRQIKQLKAKYDRTSLNTSTIVPVVDKPTVMDSPDWRAPALSKQIAEDSVSSEEDNEVISDAMSIDDSSYDEDEPELIPPVPPSISEAISEPPTQAIPEADSEELILALPSTIPSVIEGRASETSPPNDLLGPGVVALPSSTNVKAITGPPTKSRGRLGNKRQFSSPFSSIPAKRNGKRFVCRKESCERTNCIFNSLEGYRNHIKSAHPTLKFLCSWCPYATAYKQYLNNHELIHIDNDLTYNKKSASKSAICQLCNVKFSSGTTPGYNNGQLQKHNKMFH